MNWNKSLKAWPICYKQRNINYRHPQPFYMLHAGILSWTLIASNILALATSINFSYYILRSFKEEILNLKVTLTAEEVAI